jgi:SAM-dependent methyltransferase
VGAMTPSIPPTWTTGKAPNRVAALPTGWAGRLGGRIMRRTNAGEQREVLGLVDGSPADAVEVGCGPGVLLRLLTSRPGVRRVVGVDPSADMRLLAIRALAPQIADGRLEIRPGDAAATGLPAASADLVVSVNTVAIWPDLGSGVAELHRVLRPSGRLLLSWHGGERPSRLAILEEQLDRIAAALRADFGTVRRVRTRHCTVFDARP